MVSLGSLLSHFRRFLRARPSLLSLALALVALHVLMLIARFFLQFRSHHFPRAHSHCLSTPNIAQYN